MGEGYIRKVAFGNDFRLLIHRYTLNEDLIIKRNPSIDDNTLISIFFYNNEQDIALKYNNQKNISFSQKNNSAIQVTTNDLSSSICFPANRHTQYMVVGITVPKLQSLFSIDQGLVLFCYAKKGTKKGGKNPIAPLDFFSSCTDGGCFVRFGLYMTLGCCA